MFGATYLNIFILAISLLFGKGLADTSGKIDSHIDSYSYVNQTHHDNIDDTARKHVHSHKHSEDGEEHEHKHEHSNIGQYEVKVLTNLEIIQIEIKEYESNQGFRDNNLISNPHPLQIFRPPIV